MDQDALKYEGLKDRIQPIADQTGLSESASFLVWFLENIYRLDATAARDAVCDNANDKGVDGIYVDHNNEEIHFLQSKIRQKDSGTIGDVGPKHLMASTLQFDSADKIQALLAGNADGDLKRLVRRERVAEMVDAGYRLVGVYVTNEVGDQDSRAYANLTPNCRIFDREEIASRAIDIDATEGKKGSFSFDTSYVEPMRMRSGSGTNAAEMFVFPARALQLVHMEGISDGSLFKDNVRYTLGNTAVNKSIRKSIADKAVHQDFVLFHNGIIILCSEIDDSVPDELTISSYSVVNGAQSLTSFFNDKGKLTDDLRVLVRIVVVPTETLAATITENSNNQNAIRPRDLRSNHAIMLRLQREMSDRGEPYVFEIKRGEKAPDGAIVISNDETGRALMAFDLQEPWSAHQIYKVFDDKYAEIFGRPEVNAARVIFLHRLMGIVDQAMAKIENKPMASYTLTRFFVLYLISRILRANRNSKPVVADPARLDSKDLDSFLSLCAEILKTVVVDLNYESRSVDFDYKTVLKSPKQSSDLAQRILASYEKDVERDKADSFDDWHAPEDSYVADPTT